jgi:hypothetical protein
MMRLKFQFTGRQTIGGQNESEKERRVQCMDKGIKSKILEMDKVAYVEAEVKKLI